MAHVSDYFPLILCHLSNQETLTSSHSLVLFQAKASAFAGLRHRRTCPIRPFKATIQSDICVAIITVSPTALPNFIIASCGVACSWSDRLHYSKIYPSSCLVMRTIFWCHTSQCFQDSHGKYKPYLQSFSSPPLLQYHIRLS
jgi:hypothetical protein